MPLVIVSLTTIAARNGSLGPTLESLHRQSLDPDQIRVYLTPGCESIPGVQCIQVTRDRGPVTKLMALTDGNLSPDDLIVTVDDDQCYSPTWLETLIAGTERYPHAAVGMAGWNVSGFLKRRGSDHYQFVGAGPCDVVEGYAGVAYRKGFFGHPSHILNPPDPFRMVDDVWISSRLFRAGVARMIVHTPMLEKHPGPKLPGLHNRPDFVSLNRQAARLGFGP